MTVKQDQAFSPIIIRLERQEEVNALYAVANFGPTRHSILAPGGLGELCDKLRPFANGAADELQEKLLNMWLKK